MNNVGFRQYKIPHNVATGQQITINDKSYLTDQTSLQYAIDENETTFCCIKGTNHKKIKNATIIINFEEEYQCDLLHIVFNNLVNKVKIYDYSNNEKGIELLNQTKAQKQSKQIINKKISAILITEFEKNSEENDIKIQSINVLSNEIKPPQGYYFKNVEIHSVESEE